MKPNVPLNQYANWVLEDAALYVFVRTNSSWARTFTCKSTAFSPSVFFPSLLFISDDFSSFLYKTLQQTSISFTYTHTHTHAHICLLSCATGDKECLIWHGYPRPLCPSPFFRPLFLEDCFLVEQNPALGVLLSSTIDCLQRGDFILKIGCMSNRATNIILGKFLCKRPDTALHMRHLVPSCASHIFAHYNLN